MPFRELSNSDDEYYIKLEKKNINLIQMNINYTVYKYLMFEGKKEELKKEKKFMIYIYNKKIDEIIINSNNYIKEIKKNNIYATFIRILIAG